MLEHWEVQPWEDPPIDPALGSAYDIVGNGNAINDLWDYAVSNTSAFDYIAGFLLGWGFTISAWINQAQPTVTFEFPDGSEITFNITSYDTENLTVELEIASAEDAAGNNIYEDPDDYVNDDGDAVTFTAAMGGFFTGSGIELVDSAGNPISNYNPFINTCVEYSCSATPTGVKCVLETVGGWCP